MTKEEFFQTALSEANRLQKIIKPADASSAQGTFLGLLCLAINLFRINGTSKEFVHNLVDVLWDNTNAKDLSSLD